uniref:CaM kinase-like vesicle-associated protein n=1 Tax=Eptatretus burgeri TaxID=7764 RepID=A0A8C4QUF7_EPTBU
MPLNCLLARQKEYSQESDVMAKYTIGQMIKTEEYCEIFRCKEKTTGRVYACKRFVKKDGRKVRKIATNEIAILKMIKHPNVLQLVDVFETRKEFYIFLELATGREVFDWILDQGYYSERDASLVIRQVLQAVAYIHSQGVVHRNLKLENIVYYSRLRHSKVVISDFHLARLQNRMMREPCGTPEYLAPEMVGRQHYGQPVDCWAIGVITYILLSGNPPFYEEQDEEDYDSHDKNLFRKILAGDYEFDSPYWDDISDAAKELVSQLMEVDQCQRITAQEAIQHDWISGSAASSKNIKEGVCTQMEKNFAKSRWKKAVRVTSMMNQLRAKNAAASETLAGPVRQKGTGNSPVQDSTTASSSSSSGVALSTDSAVPSDLTTGPSCSDEQRSPGPTNLNSTHSPIPRPCLGIYSQPRQSSPVPSCGRGDESRCD